MTERFSRDRLNDNNHSPEPLIGSYRAASSFFELYNNQACMKNDLTRKPRTTESSLNRSEEDEESNLNEDDLNFDDIYDIGVEARDSSLNNELSSEEDEQDDKFDEVDNNENAIHQRYRKQRSNSRCIHEDEISTSFKQYAKSLPVNIPNNWPTHLANSRRASRVEQDDNLDWFSVKDNPENIAESIRVLAKSVRDDGYELFGDLPTRRFNTSEIVRDRPI